MQRACRSRLGNFFFESRLFEWTRVDRSGRRQRDELSSRGWRREGVTARKRRLIESREDL